MQFLRKLELIRLSANQREVSTSREEESARNGGFDETKKREWRKRRKWNQKWNAVSSSSMLNEKVQLQDAVEHASWTKFPSISVECGRA